MKIAKAQAQPNIALIKYWGKRETTLNIPAVSSLSITLDSLSTTTEVSFDPKFHSDEFYLNDVKQEGRPYQRVIACLDQFRQISGVKKHAHIRSENNFPTSAGLASSASGFAALVKAISRALDLKLSDQELCHIARRASGSAARSLYGGFVEMSKGNDDTGEEAIAKPLLAASAWPLTVVIAVTSTDSKLIGSTEGMKLSKNTSPYYKAWLRTHDEDMKVAREAVLSQDFEALGEVSEFSCLKMHAVAQSSRPGILYWNGVTMDCMHLIRKLRASGLPVFFTIDAGPQVKAVCLPEAADEVKNALRRVEGVKSILVSGLGEGASACRS